MEFDPVEYIFSDNSLATAAMLEQLEVLLRFTKNVLRNAGHPEVDIESLRFEVSTNDDNVNLLLRIPKRKGR